MPTAISAGDWFNASNWDTGVVPGPSDTCDLAGNSMLMSADITVSMISDSAGGGSVSPFASGLVLNATLIASQAGSALVLVSGPSMTMTFSGAIEQVTAGAVAIFVGGGATLQIGGTVSVYPQADTFPIAFQVGQYANLVGATPPSAGDLRAGVTVTGVTGTLAVPAATDVRHGVPIDDTVGTAYIPLAYDTRHGVNVDGASGTCYVPTAAQTALGVNIDHAVGTLFAPVAQGPAPQCLVTTTTVDATGAILTDQTVTFKLIKGPGTDAYAYNSLVSAASDGSGLLALYLVQGAVYQVTLGKGQTVTINVPNSGTLNLPELVG